MKRETRTLKRHNLMLFEGQMERLQELYPHTPRSVVVRVLLDRMIRQVEDDAASLRKDIEVEINLENYN